MGWFWLPLGNPDRVWRRALTLLVLTWGVLVALAALQGVAWGPTPRERFLLDFAAMGQFFVAIPAFLFGEPLIDGQMNQALKTFRSAGIVHDYSKLERTMVLAMRAAHWRLVDLFLLVLVYINTWMWTAEELTNNSGSWHARLIGGHEVVTYAGFWVWAFAVPCWFYLCARLGWKILVWAWILWRISNVKLHLVPSHPDESEGIGFLGELQATFGIVIFAVGAAIACTVSYKINIEHAPWGTFATDGPWMGYMIVAPFAFLAPLLLFSKQMYLAKHEAVMEYTPAATAYGRRFERTWITSCEYREDGVRHGQRCAGVFELERRLQGHRVHAYRPVRPGDPGASGPVGGFAHDSPVGQPLPALQHPEPPARQRWRVTGAPFPEGTRPSPRVAGSARRHSGCGRRSSTRDTITPVATATSHRSRRVEWQRDLRSTRPSC